MMISTFLRRGAVAALFTAALLLPAAPARAQHRARLSADLQDAVNAGSPAVDIILQGDRASIDATAARHGLKVKRYLKSGAVFRLTAGQVQELQQDPAYDHISSDVRITSSDVTTQTIEADQVWAGAGAIKQANGSGIGVAVIDSGVDFKHAALKGRIAVSVDFTGGDGSDAFGHGTHVASTIAGVQGSTPDTADYQGVASGARIVNLRVLGADGSGMASNVIEAIDWAIENRARYNIRVINLSLGAPVLQPYRDDPLCAAAERAVAAGIVVVAAAGNYGTTPDGRTVIGGITSPANDPSVLTVGALDAHGTSDRGDDTVASYSSRGPSMYDLVMKPDLVAPGSHVVAAEAPGSYFSVTYPQRHVAGTGEGGYIQLSGTSMAAAVASGAVALLLDERPQLSTSDVKVVLQMTSTLMPAAGLVASGAGSMNAYAAVELADGYAGTAVAEALRGTANGSSSLAVTAQSSSHGTLITFGSFTIRGRQLVWGKTYRDGKTYAWARTATSHGSNGQLAHLLSQADEDSLVWGTSDEDSLVWGTADEDSLVWGTADEDSLVWGTADEDSLVWGTADEDSLVWGTADDDSLVWGTADDDSLVWGTADEDSLVWGTADEDSLVWGTADEDSLVWGTADEDSLVWGNALEGSF